MYALPRSLCCVSTHISVSFTLSAFTLINSVKRVFSNFWWNENSFEQKRHQKRAVRRMKPGNGSRAYAYLSFSYIVHASDRATNSDRVQKQQAISSFLMLNGETICSFARSTYFERGIKSNPICVWFHLRNRFRNIWYTYLRPCQRTVSVTYLFLFRLFSFLAKLEV